MSLLLFATGLLAIAGQDGASPTVPDDAWAAKVKPKRVCERQETTGTLFSGRRVCHDVDPNQPSSVQTQRDLDRMRSSLATMAAPRG